MRYWEFIQSLFLVAGGIYLSLFIYYLYQIGIARFHGRAMYNQLNEFIKLYQNKPQDKKDEIISVEELVELLKVQCQVLYDCYVKDSKYLERRFYSANDILLKYISTVDPYNKLDLIKYELKTTNNVYNPPEIRETGSKNSIISNIINITGIVVTTIGTIVTILSFFI